MKDTQNADKAYELLKECLRLVSDPRIKSSLITAIGEFRRETSFDLLKPILENVNESYFVRYQAAIAISWIENKDVVPLLEGLLEKPSFQQLITQGALIGLTVIALSSKNSEMASKVRRLLIEHISSGKYHGVRETATFYLNYLVVENEGGINPTAFDRLKELLKDKWVHVRNNACIALGYAFRYSNNPEAIAQLNLVAGSDTDGQVRRSALEAIRKIKEARPLEEKEIAMLLTAKDMKKLTLNLKTREIEIMQRRIPRK